MEKNNPSQRLWLTFLIVVVCLFLQISIVNAAEFDNIKRYDPETRTVEVRNSILGIPFLQLDRVATIKLNTPLDNYVPIGYQKVAEFEMIFYEDYNNPLREMEFFDKKKDMEEMEKQFDYRYKTIETRISSKTVCDDNVTCYQEEGPEYEVEVWQPLQRNSFNDGEDMIIGIFTDVEKGERVEWIPTFFGVRIDEWAVWTASLEVDLLFYYNFDESSGTFLRDQVNVHNGTLFNTEDGDWETGKIGNGLHLDGVDEYVNTTFIPIYAPADDFSFSFWAKVNVPTDIAGNNFIGSKSPSDEMRFLLNGGDPRFRTIDGGTSNCDFSTNISTGEFVHIVVARDIGDDEYKIYVNGSNELNCSDPATSNLDFRNTAFYLGALNNVGTPIQLLNVTLDEMGWWNRTLSPDEVLQLYNDGNGITFGGIEGKIVSNLIAPGNNSLFSVSNLNLTGSYNVTSYTLQNITYHIWYTNGTTFNVSTFQITPSVSNVSSVIFRNLGIGDYVWNIQATGNNATSTFSNFSIENRTFSFIPFSKISESWVNNTLEGSTDLFTVNLSFITGFRLSEVRLYYNNTPSLASFTEYETNKYFVTKTQNIPQVDTDTNVTFYWNVTLETGQSIASSSQNQTIQDTGIDNCSTFGNLLFNFTLVDEKTQTILQGDPDNTSIKVDLTMFTLDQSSELFNFSFDYNETNSAAVCFKSSVGNSSFSVNAIIEYTSSNRFIEFYNIEKFVLTNNSIAQNITLYNLATAQGQEFKVTYKGQDFIPIKNLIVQIQRKYIDEGIFKVIEIPLIGTNGYTIAHLVPNDIIYNLVFIKNGQILDTFMEVVADCQNPTITPCELNLNSLITGTELLDLVNEDDFFSSLTFNKTSRVVSATFGITSGVSGLVELNVTLADNFGNTTVCSDSLNAAGGTLSCIVPNAFGNETIYASITYNGEVRRSGFISLNEVPSNLYGNALVFSGIFLFLFLIGLGISDNPAITGMFLIIGVFLLISLNVIYTTTLIGSGATVLWFVLAVIIIIVKGGSKR